MTRSNVDTTDLDAYAGELEQVADLVMPDVERVMERGAVNVRRDARRAVRNQSTGTYLPHYPRAIGYDLIRERHAVEAEVGPEVDRLQGGMGRGVEFGSMNAPPMPHLLPAAEAEEPRLERWLGQIVVEAMQ